MISYAIRRLALIIPTFIIVTLTVFLLLRFIPGDLLDMMIAQMGDVGIAAGIDREGLEARLGLDEAVHVQYLRWMGFIPDRDTGEFSGIIQGDFGDSLWRHSSVLDEILPRIPVSIELGILAIIISQLIALPIGVYSAIRQDNIGDYLARSFAILALAVPGFWLATIVVVYPSIWWGWMPALKYIPFTEDPRGNLSQFLIPAVILGMGMAGGTMRFVRTLMLEVLRQDYIRTAWAKGLSERVLVIRHALRNTLIPLVTSYGYMVPLLIGGSVIIEQIFNLPGVGRLSIDALNTRDYTIVSGINVLFATVVMLTNLFIDITYGYLDPRVRYR